MAVRQQDTSNCLHRTALLGPAARVGRTSAAVTKKSAGDGKSPKHLLKKAPEQTMYNVNKWVIARYL